ncbi:MAG: redoxin domain-containing protein [Chloroflexi bacterium]|nr:redoxin domain-containing protein [Chloroflexota bacterium]
MFKLIVYPSFLRILLLLVVVATLVACAPKPVTSPIVSASEATPTLPNPRPLYGPQPASSADSSSSPAPPVRPTAPKITLLPIVSATPAARPSPLLPTMNPTRSQGRDPGQTAYEFALQTVTGETIALSDLRGKVVMLNFWASWCGPCQIEIPHMIKLYDEFHAQGFEILAVNLREDPARVSSFVQRLGMDFPVVLDTDGRVGAAFFVRAIPTSFFLDKEGTIQFVHQGTLSEQMLRSYIERLLES